MGEISIKISISDRIYPLKVNTEEEEIVRRAAKVINERIKDYQENYAVRDKQDLLSMALCNSCFKGGVQGAGSGYRCY
jgi:cell division protein ZapA (FtsZ GTPase activity inhibitor)